MKIISIIGTRPEVIKMSPLFELLNEHFNHSIIHTGQHYDPELDSALFKELKLPKPSVRLKTGAKNSGDQIGLQIKTIYEELTKSKPDYVIVQGDTNSALCGAMAATRLGIKVIHIEAGCRSGNISAPEEQNRKMIDAISSLFFCADKQSYQNLKNEGHKKNIHLVGSTLFDACERSLQIARINIQEVFSLETEKYVLTTLHRSEGMRSLLEFKKKIAFLNWTSQFLPVVFPIHPRTKKFIKKNKIILSKNILILPPQKNLTFINLIKNARIIISDSGGVQEEAAYFNRPCLILREETEWMRLVKIKKNYLIPRIDSSAKKLLLKLIKDNTFYRKNQKIKCSESKTGASQKIMSIIQKQ